MQVNESRLVAKAQAGSVAAITKLLRGHYQQLYAVAFSYTHNQADALDVVQEASFRAVQRIDQLQDPALFGTWLTRIVINEATRLLTKRQPLSDAELGDWLPAPEGDPDAKLVVAEALTKVDARYADVLRLHYLAGHSVHEIATSMAISDNTVKTRLARGRQALRSVLEED